MKVIAVTGQLAMGKDVFCDYLADMLNQKSNDWQRNAFANAVKDTFCKAFGVDREFIEKWKRIPECPQGFLMPIRQCLQFIGDGYRQIRDEIWIEIALRDTGKNLIISDGRYINEAKEVKNRNGLMFLISRKGFLNDDPNPSESQIRPMLEWSEKHLDEGCINYQKLMMRYGFSVPNELKYYDYYIKNDGTISDLHEKIRDNVVPFVIDYFKLQNE
jgi:hypothetical protein